MRLQRTKTVTNSETASIIRLRIGIVLIFLFWIPVWMIAPLIADFVNASVQTTTLVIMTLQGVVGVIGLILAGKAALVLFKSTPRKQLPKAVWQVVKDGKYSPSE